MKILFIARLYLPHIGGVEKHIKEVGGSLVRGGNKITILTEKYNENLKDNESIDKIKIIRLFYPHVKYLGILIVWFSIWKNRKLILEADVVHVHDVFIWYLPFRFLYPKKKVYLTAHGLEFDNPMSIVSIWQKKLAVKLSSGTIGVGEYLKKYTGVTFNKIIYGGVFPKRNNLKKIKNSITYLGRLNQDTGINVFLNWAKKNPNYTIRFCGDGPLRNKCERLGKVYGFITDVDQFLLKSEYCVPGGYLSALEALNCGCKLKLFWNSRIRGDIWRNSPFIEKDAIYWARKQTWDKLANEYLDLYKSANNLSK